MIPLWASAILPVQSTCGWAFTFDGGPWVAHRVCANPVDPFIAGSWASRFAMNPLSFMTCRPLPMIATPALSYPRYSSRLRPSNRMGNAFRRPAYPTIPHIYRTTAPAGIVPRSRAPGSTRGGAHPIPDFDVLVDQGSQLRDRVPLAFHLHVRAPGRREEAGPSDHAGPDDPVLHDARGAQDHVVHQD